MFCNLAAARPTVRATDVRHTNITDYILSNDKLMFCHPQGISQFACVQEEYIKNYISMVCLTKL
jgi:hypothetical protein